MKKIIGFTLSMIMILTGICVWANDVTVKFNGEPMSFDVNPFIEKDRTLVPMRAIFESVGATVSWDDETRTVIAIMNNQDGFNYVVLQIGSEMAFLDEFENEKDKISTLEMFTKTTNEKAGAELISMLEEEQELIKSNPKLLINHLEVCASLRSDEDFVPISSIKSIDEMEGALMQIEKNIEIDENTKVRVKKHPKA